jgi:hypothetical protein
VTIKKIVLLLGLFLLPVPTVFSIDNLKLNDHLDYGSDSLDGPLITGTDTQSGFVPGKPNYVIIYGEGCFNSKRQARRTVELYNKYRSRSSILTFNARLNSNNWSSSTTRAISLTCSF